MLYLIIDTDHPFLLRKLYYFKLYKLKVKLAIFFIELRNFNENIKYNFILFIYCNLLLKNLRYKDKIGIYYI